MPSGCDLGRRSMMTSTGRGAITGAVALKPRRSLGGQGLESLEPFLSFGRGQPIEVGFGQ